MAQVTGSRQEGGPADPACVLVVDDEEDVRESLRDLVELIGCRAILAADGREALAVLAAVRPCLVVLDLLMPGMGGAELLQRMRGLPELLEVPVVMCTSAPERAPKGVPLLPKPVDVAALSGLIERVCSCA